MKHYKIKYLVGILWIVCCLLRAPYVMAQGSGGNSPSLAHKAFVPMLIEYEQGLEELSHALAEVLSVRLGKYGVEFSQRALTEKIDVAQFAWGLTLRRISERHLIITIDSSDVNLSVSEVRTVSWHADLNQLAWTIALVVEETVTPYLETQGELPALGAGLAILEPEEVGGTKKRDAISRPTYPRFHALGVGLSAAVAWDTGDGSGDIISGPRLFIEGLFSRRTLALFSVGWQGSTSFEGVDSIGKMSQLPIELYVGHIFWRKRLVRLIGWAGFSLGFAIYKTQWNDAQRNDVTFQPGGNFHVEFDAQIISPLEIFVLGGCNVPFVRDSIMINGEEIYKQVWIMPIMSVGMQLAF